MLLLPALIVAALAAAPAPRGHAPAPDSLTGPGVSRALAAYRAERVRDVRYDLALDLTARDTAWGRVTVRFSRAGSGDAILDWRGLALDSATANGRPVAAVANGAHVRVPAAALGAGENVLSFRFAAAVAPAGASVIRFHDATDDSDYLYTLLVPADANALFPCFDQPDLKARVTLALRVRRAWTAVANGAAVDSTRDGDARTFRFAETRPISTYLVGFAAGPWTVRSATVEGRRINMYVRRSRAKEVEADSLLTANGQAIAWLERYFDRPYPFDKFDFVLAPAFPFGGMEHPGAVFYNEESFVFRERPTLSQRLGRTSTIYHEVAHQWFGDLVTMRWFDDLWLKEGFATYMAAKMQAALDPGSGAWKTFYLRNKPQAYAVDASEGTTPVWQRLDNLDQAKSNYGAIVYNKAPSVLKQLEYLVGDTAFQAGLRDYLAKHAYGNATWRDLLASVGSAAHRDLTGWGQSYILRPGVPVLEATLMRRAPSATDTGATFVRLFERPARTLSGPAAWPIRTRMVVRGDGAPQQSAPVEIGPAPNRNDHYTFARLRSAPAAPALVFPNYEDEAYAITLLDSGSVAWTERNVGRTEDALLRAMLWGAMWDLVREARLAPERYLALALRELPAERDEQVASAILGRTVRATTRYLSDAQRDALQPAVESTLLAVASDRAREYGVRKSFLDAYVAVARTSAALGGLDAMLDHDDVAGIPLRPPTRWAIVTTLVEHGAPTAERRLAEEARRDDTSEGRRRAFAAAAARPTAASKAEYFRRYFADRELNEDWATASLGAFNATTQQPLTLQYLTPALDSLPWVQKNRRIFFLGSWLDAFVNGQTTPAASKRVDAFLAAHPTLPVDLRQKLLQSADELRRTVAIRARYAGG